MLQQSLPAISAAALSLVACGRDDVASPAPAKAPMAAINVDSNAPLSISLSIDGRFSQGHSWELSVTPGGKARLSISSPGNTQVDFRVSDAQLTLLRNAILRERFFELGDTYGQLVPDGSTRRISVELGQHAKTVELRFLGETGAQSPEDLREAQRPVRLWLIVRDWFEHRDAVDLRRYDRVFLKQPDP